MNSTFGHFFEYLLFLLLFQLLIPLPQVKCKKNDFSEITTKWELLKMLYDIHNLPSKFIQGIRNKPLIQLLGLANDIVEPIVTAAEVLLLFEELRKKFEMKEPDNKKIPKPVMSFSGDNKLQLNQYMPPINTLETKNTMKYVNYEPNMLSSQMKSWDHSLGLIGSESNQIRVPQTHKLVPKLIKNQYLQHKRQPKYFDSQMDLFSNNNHINFELMSDSPMNYRFEDMEIFAKKQRPIRYRIKSF